MWVLRATCCVRLSVRRNELICISRRFLYRPIIWRQSNLKMVVWIAWRIFIGQVTEQFKMANKIATTR